MMRLIYRKNEALPTIKKGFKGVPVKRGRFVGEFDSRSGRGFRQIGDLAIFVKRFLTKEKGIAKTPLKVLKEDIPKSKDFILWLGHATFFISVCGKKILTDPSFGSIPFKRRLTPPPYRLGELGEIDYLLVSHGHYDHLDLKSLKGASKIKEALVPLGMGRLIGRVNKRVAIQEAGWYQRYDTEGVEIFFLPAHHWYRRGFFDYNRVLWGSFMISCKGVNIYFAGDSGYNRHFREIRELFGYIDIAIMPINPPYIVGGSHMSHKETLKAIKDLSPKKVIAMHYGTFDLTLESTKELAEWFKNLSKNELGEAYKVLLLEIGKPLLLSR